MQPDQDTARSRLAPLDAIRGFAIALVVLSHCWTLFPLSDLRPTAPLNGLFYAGNLAVTIFFVVSGFLVTRSLLRRHTEGRLRPIRYWSVRLARIGAQVYVLLAVVLVVHWADPSDPISTPVTERSALSVATFSWNWFLQNNVLASRSDLGHLWYLSVQEQFYLALVVVFAICLRYPRIRVIAGVIALVALVTVWRHHSFVTNGPYRTSLRTTTRCDGLLWGVLAGLIADRAQALERFARPALTASLVAMLALVLGSARWQDPNYYSWQGLLMDVAVVAFVLAVHLGAHVDNRDLAARAVTLTPLIRLGAMSLTIYVWHYPLFWFVARHTSGWDFFPRTLVATGALVAISVAIERYVERPVARGLRRWSRDRPTVRPAVDTGAPERVGRPVSVGDGRSD